MTLRWPGPSGARRNEHPGLCQQGQCFAHPALHRYLPAAVALVVRSYVLIREDNSQQGQTLQVRGEVGPLAVTARSKACHSAHNACVGYQQLTLIHQRVCCLSVHRS